MDKEAFEIIENEKELRTGILSISRADLTEIPEALLEMPWLKELWLFSNKITEIKNLSALKHLQVLGLAHNEITELKNLESLTSLKELWLHDNNITEIKSLENLRKLERLAVNGNPLTELTQLEQLVRYSGLKELFLYGIKENSLNLPEELFGNDNGYNCIKELTGYFETTRHGVTFIKEVPVILVGNSTAGKTSLLCYLQNGIFPPTNDYTTHGIEPTLWRPGNELLKKTGSHQSLRNLCFYVWDFGGQEYYHSTHRLFFYKKAIYVLLWEQKTNKEGIESIPVKVRKADDSVIEVPLPVQLFPYTYWLKTIRFFAQSKQEAPVIMVQNKVDEKLNNQKKNLGDEERDEYGISEVFHLSVKAAFNTKPDGKASQDFQDFVEHLIYMAEGQLAGSARQTHWDGIKQVIRKRKNENVWTRDEFLKALQQLDPTITESGSLSYGISLQHLGFVFYYPGDDYLKNYVFINPDWVVESIYNVLDQSVLENGGEFTKGHLVNQVTEQNADVLLALMKKFELVFENEEDKVYIAPQYLAEDIKDKKALTYHKAALPGGGDISSLIIYFPDFMPPSIIQRLVTAFGNSAVARLYWKMGGLFLLNNKHVLIESDRTTRKMMIKAKDHDRAVIWTIFKELRRITNEDDRLWMSVDNGVQYVQITDVIEQIDLGNKDAKIKTMNGGSLSFKNFSWLFGTMKTIMEQNENNQRRTVRIFVSYAHKDQDYVNVFLNELTEQLNNSNKYKFISFDDRQLTLGKDWNERLEQEIERSDVGLLLMSAAFLNSEYIQEKEFGAMLEKLKNENSFVVCPIYFKAFDFEEFDFLKKYQFFKPNGAKYEQADKGTNLCFSHLVRFNNINGVNIPVPNASRDEYCLDLSKAIFKALDEKFQQ
ncbi:MAG: leucine-rich repeat protein [Ferruginibacter sp.]